MAEIVRIQSNPQTILGSLVTVLQALYSEATVIVTVNEDKAPELPPANNYVLVVPGDISPTRTMEGGGRENTVCDWSVEILPMVSLSTDPGNQDVSFLTDATLGLYTVATNIANALHLVDLTDTNGNGILVKPMRLSGKISKPKHPPAGFGSLRMQFELSFSLALPTSNGF